MESNDSAGQMDISRQQVREPYILTLEQEEDYFNRRDDQRSKLGDIVDNYLARCRSADISHCVKLLETFNELRSDLADGGEVQVPTDIVLSNQQLGDIEAMAIAEVITLIKYDIPLTLCNFVC